MVCCRTNRKTVIKLVYIFVFMSVSFNKKLLYDRVYNYCLNVNEEWASDQIVNEPCKLPKMDPFDETFLEMLKLEGAGNNNPSALDCDSTFPLLWLNWTESDANLEFTERGKNVLTTGNNDSVSCDYRIVIRNGDDKTVSFTPKVKIKRFPFKMPAEIVEVQCGDIYRDVFAVIMPKKKLSENDITKKWNVLIVGIDSISLPDVIRSLPETYKWIANQTNAYTFEGYHKIGESTFPNVIPMLTGWTLETSTTAFSFEYVGFRNFLNDSKFDSIPFVWKNYANAGYRTEFDMNQLQWNMFHANGKGFLEPPTDHYGGPFFMAQDLLKSNENPGLNEPGEFCVVGREKYKTLWDYGIRQWISRYTAISQPTFSFTWTVDIAHNDQNLIKRVDKPLLDLLKFLLLDARGENKKPWIERTIVFLLSDHGQRVGSRRSTMIGRLEDRLPFLSIFLPNTFQQKFPKLVSTLRSNIPRLITAYDIYSTFRHILHLSTTNQDIDGDVNYSEFGRSGFGRSLFTPINSQRTCAEAGVPSWYCACQKYTKMGHETDEAKKAAQILVDKLNERLVRYIANGTCHKLTFSAIKSLNRLEVGKNVIHETTSCRMLGFFKTTALVKDVYVEYLVQVETNPVKGVFEATVRHDSSNNRWKVVGNIERANRYGNQSSCLKGVDKVVRKMCACTNIKVD